MIPREKIYGTFISEQKLVKGQVWVVGEGCVPFPRKNTHICVIGKCYGIPFAAHDMFYYMTYENIDYYLTCCGTCCFPALAVKNGIQIKPGFGSEEFFTKSETVKHNKMDR